MNLQDILNRATVKPEELKKVNGEWTHLDPKTGKVITEKFSFFVVTEMTFASYTMLARVGGKYDRDAAAVAISERCRFGESGEESLTIEQAANLDPTFGFALIEAMRAAGKPNEKKRSRQRTKSGTSSSSAASAGAQSAKQSKTSR